MKILRFFSPLLAFSDLRQFFARRHPHELLFATLAVALTLIVLAGFIKDSHIARPYQRNIIYVQQWRADRSEADILAQRKIDAPIEARQKAELEKLKKERQAKFKRLDEKLTAWGF